MYFCLSCLTLKEEETRESIMKLLESLELEGETTVWFPKKQTREKFRGQYRLVDRPMLPGYLFIYWDGEEEIKFPFYEVRKVPTVIRFLHYDDRSCALKGSDEAFAKWIHMYDGNIGPSKVSFKEGQKIHICSGPLLGFDGNVVKVDRHHSRITVRFKIGENCSDVNFSVDFLSQNSKSEALSVNSQ